MPVSSLSCLDYGNIECHCSRQVAMQPQDEACRRPAPNPTEWLANLGYPHPNLTNQDSEHWPNRGRIERVFAECLWEKNKSAATYWQQNIADMKYNL